MAYLRGKTWWVSYTDSSGKTIRRSACTKNKREAEKLEQKLRLEAAQSQSGEYQHIIVDQVIHYYLENTAQKASHKSDISRAKNLLRIFTGRKLSELKRDDILKYIASRQDEGATNATINQETGLLSSAINYSNFRYEWSIPNPCTKTKQKEAEPRDYWITRIEFARLVNIARSQAANDSKQYYLPPLIILATHTGMRRGEMLKLKWCDVDFTRRIVRLPAPNTKNRKSRAVPLNEDAISALRELQTHQTQRGILSDHVFYSPTSKSGHIEEIKRSFNQARTAANLPELHFHDLRHTFATWALMNGVPLPFIAKIMGHSTTHMTERYAHHDMEQLTQAVDGLAGAKM